MMFTAIAWMFLLFASGCDKGSDHDDPNPVVPPVDTTTQTVIPAGWSKVGDLKANDMIWSLVTDASGNLYAAGYFTNAAGYCYVARWDGTSWSELGTLKANSGIFALTVDAGGHVYATGQFSNGITPTGGVNYVARWYGSAWQDIGGGGGTNIASDAIGNVYKGTQKWDGNSWKTLCPLCTLTVINPYAVAPTPDGSVVYAGGNFQLFSGARYVAACDASDCWDETGSLNANGDIQALAIDSQGNLYAAGRFTNGVLPSTGSYYVAKWDGTSWNELGNLNANGDIYYLAINPVNNDIYATGYFLNSAGESFIAKWDGSGWSNMGNMMLSPAPIHVSASGKLYSAVASTNGKMFTVVVKD